MVEGGYVKVSGGQGVAALPCRGGLVVGTAGAGDRDTGLQQVAPVLSQGTASRSVTQRGDRATTERVQERTTTCIEKEMDKGKIWKRERERERKITREREREK